MFLLDENSLVELLGDLEVLTAGAYLWSETAGLKQLIRERPLTTEDALELMSADYGTAA